MILTPLISTNSRGNILKRISILLVFVILISVGTTSAYAINITLGGTVDITQTLNMMGNKITNVGSPIAGTDAATKAYVDQAPSTNSYLLQLGSAEGLANLTVYACNGKSDTFYKMDECSTVVPTSGTISKLNAVSAFQGALTAPGGGGLSYTVTLVKNGVDTALSCVISNAATSCSDTSTQVSVSPGDLIDVKVTSTCCVPQSWVSASAILTPQ